MNRRVERNPKMINLFESLKWHLSIIFIIVVICPAGFAEEWERRAFLDVDGTGITEAVLPPELLMRRDNGKYDLTLSGPDGLPRAFELFMKEETAVRKRVLDPVSIRLNDSGGFIWEAKLPEIPMDEIRVEIGDRNYLGRIDISVDNGDGWSVIAGNQAVYRTGREARATIDLNAGICRKIRLEFTGFDKRYRRKIVPIRQVTLVSREKKQGYVERDILLTDRMRIGEADTFTELKMVLPGKGIDIRQLRLITGIQFQGRWELGEERIRNGERRFVQKQSGVVSHVDSRGNRISISVNSVWESESMILRLRPEVGYLGTINRADMRVRLPRLVFSADKGGLYTAATGLGNPVRIRPTAGDSKRLPVNFPVFRKPEINLWYNTPSLVEKYRVQGGPFSTEGYRWKSPVQIEKSGYYRLVLDMETTLGDAARQVRLVKNDKQVPFFFGRNEYKTCELPMETDYDEASNTTTLTIALPVRSDGWRDFYLTASGIFTRDLNGYRPKPGMTGWEKVLTKRWTHTGEGETRLRIQNSGRLMNGEEFRITIAHGDNQPVAMLKPEAGFMAASICFLAYEPGNYTLFGGNEEVQPARYDLSLIQDRLLAALPDEANMGQRTQLRGQGWWKRLGELFQGKSPGLYVVLGIVTLILVGIVIRLFPEAGKPD